MTLTTEASTLHRSRGTFLLSGCALLASLFAFAAARCSYAIAPLQVDAIAQFGTPGYDEGFGVSPTAGGAYVVGSLAEDAATTVAYRPRDAYIAKYNDNAELLWSRTFGEPGDIDRFHGVATGPSGNAVAVGYYTTNPITQPDRDGFIVSYSPDGEELWRTHLDIGGRELLFDVAVAPTGDSFVVGRLTYQDDRDPDAFLTRIDQSGNVVWSELLGGDPEYIEAIGVALDDAGDVYVAGNRSPGRSRGFLRSYTQHGSLSWERNLSDPGGVRDIVRGVNVDGNGVVSVTGETREPISDQSDRGSDAFLAQYDASGDLLNRVQYGTTDTLDIGWDIDFTADGSSIAVGQGGDFGGGLVGERDAYVATFDSDGVLGDVMSFGTEQFDSLRAVATADSGLVYAVGSTRGDFGGGSFGGRDGFFVVLNQVPEPSGLVLLAACSGLAFLRRRRAE